jgi:type II secretory pathway component GspD/PulD (secretin)
VSSSFRARAARTVTALVILLLTLNPGKAPAATHTLVAQLTSTQAGVRFAQLYKLRYLDAKSVATVLRRSFANVQISVVNEVNGLSITASAAQHQRIADALAQLDLPNGIKPAIGVVPPSSAVPPPLAASGGTTGVDVVTLHAAVPGINGVASSSASDIASAVMQALSPSLPDLRITIYGSQSQLLLTGSPNTIRIARELIDKLDALQKMVVLDVTILEVDENTSKDLGLSLVPAVISTTYTETTPAAPANGGATPPLLGLQQLSRTPLSLGVQLNLLIQNGKAKVLADPKLTTISGRTASLRAGDNIAILTTTGGSVGTVATTQLQTFNTGVQLDITPVINADNFISVSLHPTVNNLSSILNGVPQISTRDVQTTVALREGQSLIIGGLIEDSYNRSEQKIPLLGYLPIVGPAFTRTTISGQRNELIITVTPHVIDPLTASVTPPAGPAMTTLPTPNPLPTLAPSTYIQLPGDAPSGSAPSTLPQSTPTIAPKAGATSGGSFVYGARPAAIPATRVNDPPRLLYVSASPQLVKNGTPTTIEAVTTPNVTRVVVQLGTATVSLTQASPGLWSATVPLSLPNTSQSNVTAVLSAARADGVATTLNIPFTIAP